MRGLMWLRVIAFAFVVPACVFAQTTALERPLLPDGDVALPPAARITSSVNEVQLSFAALQHGKFVTDLTENDLKLLDDNAPPARVGSFWKNEGLPLRVAFVVDTSGSVEHAVRTEQRSAIQFLEKLLHDGNDQAMVIGFSTTATLEQDLTGDHKAISAAVKKLRSTKDGTAMYDALRFACEHLHDASEKPVRRAIVLISDGDDNSSKAKAADAVRMAQNSDVAIYAVQVNSFVFKHDSRPHALLTTLANETGGKLYEADGNTHFSPAFKRIEQELRSRYVLTYTPAAWQSDGRFRKISLHARRPGVRIQCRPGYWAEVRDQ